MTDQAPRGRPPVRREQARLYLIEHPEAKDKEVSQNLGIDMATVGRARGDLINEGLLDASTRPRTMGMREFNAEKKAEVAALVPPARGKAAPKAQDSLLTDADLRMLEEDAGSDDETRKKILVALRKIAFSPGMNYETAMNAMALWIKLKDAAATKELGPGKPLTYADAKERLSTLMKACGFELVFECFQDLFVPKEPAHGTATDKSDDGGVPPPSPELPALPA